MASIPKSKSRCSIRTIARPIARPALGSVPRRPSCFPKYKAGPINGDAVSEGDLNREKMKIDISALLGGDVYGLLRDRSQRAQSRFSKERDSEKALAERQKCLSKLAGLAADIPPEGSDELAVPRGNRPEGRRSRRPRQRGPRRGHPLTPCCHA